jgi:hypothetical protein
VRRGFPTNDVISNVLLPPNAVSSVTLNAQSESKVVQEDIDLLKSGKYRLLVFGRFEYDIFGCPHWTTFCSFLQYREISGGWNYMSYKKYNDADNNRCTETK